MKIHLSLSSANTVYYRGLQVAFDQSVHDKSHIIWLTNDREYAMRYAADPRMLHRFVVHVNKGFNFGFRTFETEVTLGDVLSRIKVAMQKRANSGPINRAQHMAVMDRIKAIKVDGTKFKKVWAWYMEDKRIVEILKIAGYDHVIGREGPADKIPTIGVFDPKNVEVTL